MPILLNEINYVLFLPTAESEKWHKPPKMQHFQEKVNSVVSTKNYRKKSV